MSQADLKNSVGVRLEKSFRKKLDNLSVGERFSTNRCRSSLASALVDEGLAVVRHSNGKIDLSSFAPAAAAEAAASAEDEELEAESIDSGGRVVIRSAGQEHRCHYCHHTFAYRHVLERHILRIHEKHTMPHYQCPKCAYTSVWKEQMRSHFSVIHQDFRPYSCSECDFRAPKPCRVQAHIQRSHKGVGTYNFDASLKPRDVSPTRRPIPSRCKRSASSRGERLSWKSSSSSDEKHEETEIVIVIQPEVKSEPPDDDEPAIKKQVLVSVVRSPPSRVMPPAKATPQPAAKATQRATGPTTIAATGSVSMKGMTSKPSVFHCPFCNFSCGTQLAMGEHVIEVHEDD